MTQAAGRAGRGGQAGEVVIQTYTPQHYAITSAAQQDYLLFYEQEMRYRELSGYPPCGGMMAVHCAAEEMCIRDRYIDERRESGMKLTKLLEHVSWKCLQGSVDVEVESVINDSRKVEEGSLFFCIKGAVTDGLSLINI